MADYPTSVDIDTLLKTADKTAAREALDLGATDAPTFDKVTETSRPQVYVTPEEMGLPMTTSAETTLAIQAALDTRKPVMLAGKQYYISGPLVLDEGQQIMGVSWNSNSGDGHEGSRIVGSHSGIVLHCQYDSWSIENLMVAPGAGGTGIHVENNGHGGRINNVRVTGGAIGVYCNSWWQVYHGLECQDQTDTGFYSGSGNSNVIQAKLTPGIGTNAGAKAFNLGSGNGSVYRLSVDGDFDTPSTAHSAKGMQMSLYQERSNSPSGLPDVPMFQFGTDSNAIYNLELHMFCSMKEFPETAQYCQLINVHGAKVNIATSNIRKTNFIAVDERCSDIEVMTSIFDGQFTKSCIQRPEFVHIGRKAKNIVDHSQLGSPITSTDVSVTLETDWSTLPTDSTVASMALMIAQTDKMYGYTTRVTGVGVFVRTGKIDSYAGWSRWEDVLPDNVDYFRLENLTGAVSAKCEFASIDLPADIGTILTDDPRGTFLTFVTWIYAPSLYYTNGERHTNFYQFQKGGAVATVDASTGLGDNLSVGRWTCSPAGGYFYHDRDEIRLDLYNQHTLGTAGDIGQLCWFSKPRAYMTHVRQAAVNARRDGENSW